MLPTNPPHARARRLPLFFRGLGKHGIASARNLRVVTSAWFENASAWERDFWLPLFAQFGELAEEAPRRPIKSAAPKKKAKPKAKKPASTKERTVVPQASSKETEPFIPRFPGR